MLQADGIDDSGFRLGGDFPEADESEDLSISLDTFYAILEEKDERDPSSRLTQSLSPSSADDLPCKNSLHARLNAVAQNLEGASQSQYGLQQYECVLPLETGVPGSSPLSPSDYLAVSDSIRKTSLEVSDSIKKTGFDVLDYLEVLDSTKSTELEFPFDPLCNFGNFNDLYSASLDHGRPDTSLQQIDSKFPIVESGPNPSDWLTLSTADPHPYSPNPVDNSVDLLINNQHLQHGTSSFCISSEYIVGEASHCSDHLDCVDLTHSDSEDVEFGHMEVGSLFKMEVKQSARDINLASVLPNSDQNQKRTGSADFSHLIFVENSGLNFGKDHRSTSTIIESKSGSHEEMLEISSAEGAYIDANRFPQAMPCTQLNSGHDAITVPYVENNAEMYILEDISGRSYPLSVPPTKSHATSQLAMLNAPIPRVGIERPRINDERLTFRVALQDLSQAKSEASPPDGVLAVPLLRHQSGIVVQRIALSWMVQKETASLHCSGGILADDQGLGKTISTIALIVMEKSPSSKSSPEALEQVKTEALNLDEDEDGVSDLNGMKRGGNSGSLILDKRTIKSENTPAIGKGRPAAGTLVVCPTSVLRQWADELHYKVTEKAKLRVLVYHGSHRTKDPLELAKYDVVLTTYSIVSMEVPKQPLVGQDDDEKKRAEGQGLTTGPSPNRKRKHPANANKKNIKDPDSSLHESVARPLARVGWFRVVLDEAQSIKNHRTQVARACWGLRAKRRWCLSGTPIQNAVDDLYSYFRFLRYDPYAVYKSFCSTIKIPIHRNPTTGYKKLQAVLKTIMLRRTKGTLIDGEPIINLPPKSVSLRKVDFSEEERAFYTRLEAESRAQFKVYAAEGTVKQNYVNILLMLLRLRQACDHPLLVIKYSSNSVGSSSVDVVKKLPREKQMDLLNCLEASLAICGICNDPPEDAVVSICGHVFCNQCICEHLTGDENLCPAARCKGQLNATSIFSKGTLRSSLSDQPGDDCCSDSSCSGHIRTPDLCLASLSSDSSKIKAAFEILKSLPKPCEANLKNSSKEFSDNAAVCLANLHDKTLPYMETSSSVQILHVPEKAIVFSQWTRMLDLLEVPLRNSSIQYRRLDGTMSVAARDKAVKDFNTLPEVTVMIMSLKAASLGLNMVAACHVLLLDLWWNPTTEDQAIDRAHRIGQTRPVTVCRLTVKDTVEDRILALQEKKREMVASAFGEDENGRHQTRLTVDDLKYLFMA